MYKQVTHCAQTADVTGMQLLTSHQSAVDDVVPYAPTNTHTHINIHNPTTYCHSHMHVVIKTCIHTHTVQCGMWLWGNVIQIARWQHPAMSHDILG